MPEIKTTFTAGRMNKDIDERLISKGEYRDAMNVQVMTSEGSDIGTIQNILGNTKVASNITLSDNAVCVGSVADEKDNAVYWFVHEPTPSLGLTGDALDLEVPETMTRDLILQYKDGVIKPVVVDIHERVTNLSNVNGSAIFDIGVVLPDPEEYAITSVIDLSTGQEYSGMKGVLKALTQTTMHITWTALGMSVAQLFGNQATNLAVKLTKQKVLNLPDHNKRITGINILDRFLLWTDGESEPKKINIDRCIDGTNPNGLIHTNLLIDGIFRDYLKEEYITVIRKGPDHAPKLTIKQTEREGILSSSTELTLFANPTTSLLLEDNDETWVVINSNNGIIPNFLIGDTINFEPTTSGLFPPETYKVRGKIIDILAGGVGVIAPNGASVAVNQIGVKVSILTISTETPVTPTIYEVAFENNIKGLFERKLPRFSCRYKYADGEFSPPGTFTETAFTPGNFRYHPKEAYNKGMVNNIKELFVQNFVPINLPKDVIQIDLLYKNETSPNIYVIDSFKEDDPIDSTGYNPWNHPGSKTNTKGNYKINTENIFRTLPSNQSLRVYDNVPRKALAQEVAGNRVVYGNYTQGYDMKDSLGAAVVPAFNVSLEKRLKTTTANKGQKSIKSIRDYELGLVYGDKYGRETPVVTHGSGAITTQKSHAADSNSLDVLLNHTHPEWADYYKFYVKETSNEYYNLAMDRVYDAGDGNVWVSFPSVDRNKVDEETYLVLKKGIDTEDPLTEEARYKIVAIENEAPDHLKTVITTIAQPPSSSTLHPFLLFDGDGSAAIPTTPPSTGKSFFRIHEHRWTAEGPSNFYLPSLEKLWEERGSNDLLVSFTNEVDGLKLQSEKYTITSVTYEANGANNTSGGNGVFIVHIDRPIISSENWIADNIDAGWNNNKTRVYIHKKETVNKKEFNGRFFVKIVEDDIVKNHLKKATSTSTFWEIQADTDLYYLADSSAPTAGGVGTTGYTASKTYLQWENNLSFGTGGVLGKWFIDEASYAGKQPLSSNSFLDADPFDGGTILSDSTTGKSLGLAFNKGVYTSSGSHYLSLSFSALKSDVDNLVWGSTVGTFTIQSGMMIDWRVGEAGNTHTDQEEDVVSSLTPGQLFKMKNDPSVYRIKSVTKKRLYNYQGFVPGFVNNIITGPSSGSLITTTILQGPSFAQAVGDVSSIVHHNNKRINYTIEYEINPSSVTSSSLLDQNSAIGNITASTSGTLQFVKEATINEIPTISSNPAIFETEPKEDVDLDIYYEASNKIPVNKTDLKGLKRLIPIGATIHASPANGSGGNVYPEGTFVTGYNEDTGGLILSNTISISDFGLVDDVSFTLDDNSIVYGTKISGSVSSGVITDIKIEPSNRTTLGWFNCWSFNNGVESNRIGDTFNKPYLQNGVKASTTLEEGVKEEHKTNSLIWSGIYNTNSNTNNLNQFIQAEKITKDINPSYGSIQKLHTRDSDLIVLCEDKVLKVLANKDAVYNADGNPQLVATSNVLGQTIPFAGEYGISKNPESFVSEAYRAYFTDKVRGAVLRLSMDGLTPISEVGMSDYFKDNLKEHSLLIGSYDDRKNNYNISGTGGKGEFTASYNENVKGWVSFKSFIPESGISMSNDYYTFKNGEIWKHHDENSVYNSFYGSGVNPSTVTAVLNDSPGVIKSFKTLAYEGTQSAITGNVNDNQYYNLSNIDGWKVTQLNTDLQEGMVDEFINKEGKWFNHIKGVSTSLKNIDPSEFTFQGIGMVHTISGTE